MAQNYIPPFPNPKTGDDVNYTERFKIAREERMVGVTANPKDSSRNPKTNPPPPPPPTKTKTEGLKPGDAPSDGRRPVKALTRPDPQQYEDKVDDGLLHQRSSKIVSRGPPSPPRPAYESKPTRKDGVNPRVERHPMHNTRHQQYKGQRDDGSSRPRPNKVTSRDPSPRHPTHESKSTRKDRTNPITDRVPTDHGSHTPGRVPFNGHGSHTPGRSGRRHVGGPGYERPVEDHYAVPPLPNFDETNAANITDVFKKAREDLATASPNVNAKPTGPTTMCENSAQKSCSCCAVM